MTENKLYTILLFDVHIFKTTSEENTLYEIFLYFKYFS